VKAVEKEHRVFHLLSYGQAVHSPLPEGQRASDNGSTHPALAILSAKGNLSSGSFHLRFSETAFSPRGFLCVLITALEVWVRIVDGKLSRQYLEDTIKKAGSFVDPYTKLT
jgi:hypothetical protein